MDLEAAREMVESKDIPQIEEDIVIKENKVEEDEIESECPVCLCFMVEPTRFPAKCGHVFCRCCLKTIVEKCNQG